MSKKELLADIKTTLGIVPGFFEMMPEDSLPMEWGLFKRYVLQPKSEIPPKYRELIGLGAAAAKQCWYCANFHTGVARLHGATDAEIEETIHLARFGASWSAYLNGSVYGHDKFMKEIQAVGKHLSKK
jgi:AhpD family alkylhydroperoxidase